MPATDWREITFSRAPLRPGDGRDTKVKDLYRECVTISKRIAVRPPGQDLAASASDLEEYAKAKDMVTEAEKRLSKNEGKLKQDEMTRQELERKNLNESLIMRKETFDAEWKHKRQEMEKHTRQKMQGNLDRADGQRMALELTLKKASKSQPKVKYSSTVRDERILENKHSAAFEFELASRFSKSLAGQKTQEQSNHAKGVQDGIEMKRERLELRLEREKEDMRDACERHRLAFELQLKNAEERQKQAERNLRADSEHALANEWGQRREVRKSLMTTGKLVKSYNSRPTTSSTFFGRNMMERAGRGSRDVPSVCKMEWEDIPTTPRYDAAKGGAKGKGDTTRPPTAAGK